LHLCQQCRADRGQCHTFRRPLDQLRVTTAQRLPMLPDVPTMGEATSFPFEVSSTFGILAPAGTPKSIIARLNAEFAQAVQILCCSDHLSSNEAYSADTLRAPPLPARALAAGRAASVATATFPTATFGGGHPPCTRFVG
jgi:hypothetical protein